MEITNKQLVAYAKGNVSDSERKAVRQYLIDNPDEMESVMMMMDEDYDIQLEDNKRRNSSQSFSRELDALLDEIELEETTPVNILPIMFRITKKN